MYFPDLERHLMDLTNIGGRARESIFAFNEEHVGGPEPAMVEDLEEPITELRLAKGVFPTSVREHVRTVRPVARLRS